jgi:hypothetical protein
LFGIFVDRRVVEEEWKRYEASRFLFPQEREDVLVSLVTRLEEHILAGKPPATKRLYTKDTLRDEILRQVRIEALPPSIRLLFSPRELQLALLFEQGLLSIVRFILTGIGKAVLSDISGVVQTKAPWMKIAMGSAEYDLRRTPRLFTSRLYLS